MQIRWIDIAEASSLTGYHPNTLRKMCMEREREGLPGVFRNPGRNGRWRIKPDIVWPQMYR